MNGYEWQDSLYDTYCDGEHYLRIGECGDADAVVEEHEDEYLVTWDGTEYPHIFFVLIHCGKETLEILDFDVQSEIEIEPGPGRPYSEDCDLPDELQDNFLGYFEPLVTMDQDEALRSLENDEEEEKEQED